MIDGTQSDTHAEVNLVGACAAAGIRTEGACIYITMPPCKCVVLRMATSVRARARQWVVRVWVM